MRAGMKERITSRAAELFSKHGYAGVRVDDIAHFSGVSKKTLYNHFTNKSSLICAVIESKTRNLCKRLDEFMPEKGKDLNGVQQVYLLIVFGCRELSGDLLSAVENGPLSLLETVESALEQVRRKILKRAEELLCEAAGSSKARDDLSCRVLFGLCKTVIEGVFCINSLCRADEIDRNPLMCNLKSVADDYKMKNAGSSVDSEQRIVEELERRIKELEEESAELKQVEDDLRKSKARFSLALETSKAMPWEINLQTCKWHCDPEDYGTYGYETKEEFEKMIRMVESTLRYLKDTDDLSKAIEDLEIPTHPEDYDRLYSGGKAVLNGKKNAYEGDFRMLGKDGKWLWYYGKAKVTGWDKDGNSEILSGITLDITERKKAEETLMEREARLATQTHALEETNTALKVLLKNREEDKKELEEKMVTNLKEMVFPFIKKLRASHLNERQMVFLEIIKSHLEDMTAPFLYRLSSKYSDLTPAEVKVAVFVKEGKTTKEIAELLDSSVDAVSFHRNNLRKKFGLVNSKINLRMHLLSLL